MPFVPGRPMRWPLSSVRRYETIIDDGKTCVIEWCHIVSKQGQQKRNRIAMSGCSAYTRNDEGYLCSVRISDYAGHEGAGRLK